MRKRIGRLARGQFDYIQPAVDFSDEKIALHVTEDMEADGSFELVCTNGCTLRGVVYSTNERMECLTPQFEGEQAKIRYRFHGKGLTEGEVHEGSFEVVCCGARYQLPFTAEIVRNYPDSSMGRITSLREFAALAREHWDEAYQLFYHKNFVRLFKPGESAERLLYRGIADARPSNRNLEEFLIGIHKKDPIHFEVQEENEEFSAIYQPVRQILHIRKDGWGYFSMTAWADAPFIQLDKAILGPEDFLGSGCSLYYVIDPAKLHDGRNYGRITLQTPYQKMDITVLVHNGSVAHPLPQHRQMGEYQAALVQLYQTYRLGRMVTGTWVNETVDLLTELHAIDPKQPFYLLCKAHTYLIGRQRQEAEWILDDFRHNWHDRRSPLWGYYLYLQTMLEREPSYVDRLTREIEAVFRENPDSLLLFWTLLSLRESYFDNSQEKLRAIGRWIENGYPSPLLYLEAYDLILAEPYLLRDFGTYERRLLCWMRRMNCITPEIAEQIFVVADGSRQFDRNIYKVLCAAYEVDSRPEYVGTICSYLIKGQQFDTAYHHWYASGVDEGLKITGLYEAYLLSLDEREVAPMPKIIQLYFQYRSNLPYRKLAVLYNNIIATREESPEIYANYVKAIGRFAMEQSQLQHMDDNLAVVYSNMLELGLLDKDIAHNFAQILFTRKLYVPDEAIVRVCVCQMQMKDVQVVPVVNHVAYFRAYSKDYCLLLEDALGQRYAASIDYVDQALMDSDTYLEKCMELSPMEIPYIIAWFDRDNRRGQMRRMAEKEDCCNRLICSDEVSQEYKALIVTELLHQLRGNSGGEEFLYTFVREMDISYLQAGARREFFGLMVHHGIYDKVYEYLQEYGADQLEPRAARVLVEHMIELCNGEEDEFLVTLGMRVYLANKGEVESPGGPPGNSPQIVQYLCNYYEGPTERMYVLWKTAFALDLDTYELEERVLTQMLFADEMFEGVEELFAHYYQNGGDEQLVMAYLTVVSHDYFVEKTNGQQPVFEILQARHLYHMQLNTPCKLALLKYLAGLPNLSPAQKETTDDLLGECIRQNMYFKFYEGLDPDLIRKYYLYDKVILEYHTKPGTDVVLRYSRDEDDGRFTEEKMTHVYDGIYVKLFVMFFGEMTRYQIVEQEAGRIRVTSSGRVLGKAVSTHDNRRYERMNWMLMTEALAQREELEGQMRRYQELDEMTKSVFKCI